MTPHLPYHTIPVFLKLWDGAEVPPNPRRLDRYGRWIPSQPVLAHPGLDGNLKSKTSEVLHCAVTRT